MKKALSILLAALILLPATCLPVFADDAPAFSTYDEMVAYVRQALTARDANIRFRFDGSGFQPPAISDLCADSADGKAGDYLRLSFDGGFPQTTKDADGVYTVAARFFTDAAQEAQVDAFVRGAADACEAQTPREKARYIYDLLCSEVAFDLENLYDEAVTSKYTAWGAAVEGKAVCQGFAQLYYRLAKALDLPCRIVTGTRAGENHAWNIVEVDGYWYHVDAASGAQLADPSWFFLKPGFSAYAILYNDYTATEIMQYAFAPADPERTVSAGSLGYLISWTLNKETGELLIEGTGNTLRGSTIFHNNTNIRSVVFGDGITQIGDNLFAGCENLKSVRLPASVDSLISNPFASCGLDTIEVDAGNPVYRVEGNCLINTREKALVAGTNLSVIPDDGSVKTIGYRAFAGLTALTEIEVPEGVTSIGDNAFERCTSLSAVTLPDSLQTIWGGAFSDCALEQIEFPDGLQTIGDMAFFDCGALSSFQIPASVTSLGSLAFDGTAWYKAQSANPVYIGDIAYKYKDPFGSDMAIFPYLPEDYTEDVVLRDGTRLIADSAFADTARIASITLPDSVEKIGLRAFDRCVSLTSITIGKGLREIADGAFRNMPGIESIQVSRDNPVYHAFGNCLIETGTKTLILGGNHSVIPTDGSVTRIGNEAFHQKTKLGAIAIPNCVTEIGNDAFMQCTGLTEAIIPDSVTDLGDGAFACCSGLTSITIPGSVGTIGGETFSDCTGLTDLTIGDGVHTISFSAFQRCSGITELHLPDSVTTIKIGAFNHCTGLRSVTLSRNLTELVNEIFWNCTALTDVFIPNSASVFSGSPFMDCDSVTIYGYANSTAQTFAAEKGIPFVAVCPVTDAPHAAVAVDAFDATCLEPAYTAGTRCADCGEWLSGHEPVGEPLGHTGAAPVRENVTEPTCTAEGAYDAVIYCARCGEKLSSTRERIAAVPHADRDENGFCDDCGADICEHSRTRERVGEAPATCTANGYSGDTVCLICGRTLLYGATIPAAGHAPVMTVTAVSPTCISAGRTAGYACAVCGEITTASRVLPVSGHTDDDADGWCDVCFAPEDCTRYGVCGDAMYWFVANETLTLSGAGDSYAFSGNAPWDAYRDDFDCVYLRTGVRTVDGTAFGAANRVFAPAGASVTDCPVPALVYTDDHGTVSLTQTDGVCAMQVYDVLNAAYVLCMDREVRALRFDEIALESTEDDFTYDILMNGKLVDERHFTVPAGTVVRDFTVKTAGYASFNDAMAALGSHPDRNLILTVRCADLLLASMKTDPDSYTVQIVVRFVDEPDAPVPDEEPEQKGFLGSFIDRFKATLAAILALFRKLFKLFTGK